MIALISRICQTVKTYAIPRIGWNYEEVNGRKIYGSEDLSVGNFYGVYWLNVRWRSAQDGRTRMLSVTVCRRGKVVFNRYLVRPQD